jgi:multidrug resistance efflux pump
VVQVSADVAGLVTQIHVHDNQPVRAGDLLFTVDQER